ncbi:MAG: MlaD family protein [Halieaceae bacterium]|nr:MlaD family protein [Halieaceae bacterium]
MERNARIIMVATFVVLSLLGLVAFYQWIKGPDPEEMGVDMAILFDGSVSGLSIGSQVRYLGVPVGRVSGIALSREYPGRVDVTFGTRETLPPVEDMVALLEAQGITGLSVIELQERSVETPGFEVPDGVIPGYPSLFSQLAGSAGRITNSVENTLTRLDNLLSDEAADNLGVTIAELRKLTENLSAASTDIDKLMASAGRVSEELEATLPQFRLVGQQLSSEVLPTVAEAGRSLQSATDAVANTLGENGEEVQALLTDEIPALVGLTDDLASTLRELNSLLGNINDEPGALLYGETVREVEISRD